MLNNDDEEEEMLYAFPWGEETRTSPLGEVRT